MNGIERRRKKGMCNDMALTKARILEILSEAGLDKDRASDAAGKIMDGHTASINVLRERAESAETQRDTYKAEADKLSVVQKELDDMKKAGWERKFQDERAAFDAYKADVNERETRAAKENAVRAYYQARNITGNGLEIAMRGSTAEIAALELDETGNIRDAAALDALVNGDFAALVSHDEVTPAHQPPASAGNRVSAPMSLSEAMKAKNENPGLEIDYTRWFPPEKKG